ncbi:Nucleoid occlusion factor SlmA [Candidatus Brocadiaceae bacterium]|nr:Nucleoid occlusion factor SlmA [Candidatus Brocadiaceae bacterium]
MQIRKHTEIRRQQIIDIIRHIISSKGIEYVTISEIASRIGTTKTAIYRHFKNKRDILSLLIDNIEETLMSKLDKAMMGDDPIQNLKKVLLAHLTYAKERRETSFIVIMGATQFSDMVIRRKISRLIQKYLRKIEKMLSCAMKLGLVRNTTNPRISAITFLGLIQSTVTIWSYKNFNFIPQKIHAHLWNIYCNGIGA